MRQLIPILFGLFVFCITGWSQNLVPDNIDLSYLEEFLEGEDEIDNTTVEDLLNNLRYYSQYPLNINKAGFDEFKELFILNDLQIQQILRHRILYGEFLTIHELQTIPSLAAPTVKKLSPLLTVENAGEKEGPLWNWFGAGDNVVFMRWTRTLETQRGYEQSSSGNSAFVGDPNKLYLRYRHQYLKKLSYGVTMEKDAGEVLLDDQRPTRIDYTSIHVALRDVGKIRDLVIGDFSLNVGQGLLVSTRFNSGKSSYTMNIKRGGRVIHPYTALNEYNFFRGVAATVDVLPHINLSLWGSSRKLDGSEFVSSDSLSQIRSISTSGLHRTSGEINRRGNLRQDALGGQIKFKNRMLEVGINGMYYKLDKPLISSERLYNRFDLNSDNLALIGLDYSIAMKNFLFFGEIGTNHFEKFGQTHGLLMSLYRFADFSILYRNLRPGFNTFHGDIFSESGNNESGLYSGLSLRINNQISLSTYVDLFRFPWPRFRINRPSLGQEFLSRLTYYKKRKYEVYVQFKFESKARNHTSGDGAITDVHNYSKRNIRLHGEYRFNQDFTYRGRIEFSQFDYTDTRETGTIIYQDLLYRPLGKSFSGNVRLAYFNTDGFDSRIYMYENDLINNYSIPFLYLKGFRYYTNLRYRFKNITLEARIARSHFQNRTSIGSGNFKIDGNTKTDCKLQIKINW